MTTRTLDAPELPASFPAQVWATLSRIDVGDHIETKGDRVKLSYLSWSWAWAQLMNHYPESQMVVLPPERLDDGTVTVNVGVEVIEGENRLVRQMWLPVMGNTNKAITNPDAYALNTSTMRCMVKCLALFGLGLDLYAKSDMPVGSWDDPLTPEQAVLLATLYNKLPVQRQTAFLEWQGVKDVAEIPQSKYKDARLNLEKVVREL